MHGVEVRSESNQSLQQIVAWVAQCPAYLHANSNSGMVACTDHSQQKQTDCQLRHADPSGRPTLRAVNAIQSARLAPGPSNTSIGSTPSQPAALHTGKQINWVNNSDAQCTTSQPPACWHPQKAYVGFSKAQVIPNDNIFNNWLRVGLQAACARHRRHATERCMRALFDATWFYAI